MTSYRAQREAQQRIITALQLMGIPRAKWPTFIQLPLPVEAHQTVTPWPFQPPDFERLHQSIDEWVKAADAAWQKYRDGVVQGWQTCVQKGVDAAVPVAKSRRGPGNNRRNANTGDRYKWAALRLSGLDWKEIAARSNATISGVTKAASEVLRAAEWPTKLKADQRCAPVTYTHQKFPKWKYHRTEPACTVGDAEQEAALGDGWVDTPTAFEAELEP
jgi:hypothetical protein